jgi:outer membrane protein assembly factor BamB
MVDAIGDTFITEQSGDANTTSLVALNARGQVLWRQTTPTYTGSAGAALGNDGTLYFPEFGGALYAYYDPS